MRQEKFCDNPACEPPRPTKGGRKYCERCWKRAQRAKKGGLSLSAPPMEKLSPMERAIEAMNRLAETPAEDDAAYAANERALLATLKDLAGRARPEAIRRGLARARASGKRIGRPPKLGGQDAEMARALVPAVGIMAAAKALGVDRRTLHRALADWQKGNVSAVVTERTGRQKGFVFAALGAR